MRNSFLTSALFASFVLPWFAPTRGTADDWLVSRGDAASSGVSRSKMPAAPDLLWEYKNEKTAFEATPIIAEGCVYIGDLDGTLYAIDFQTGKERWKKESESGYVASAAYRQGRLVTGNYDGLVQCWRAEDGQEIWQHETGAQIDGGANFYGDLVLVTSEDGKLYALEFETGKLRWEYETGDQLRCAPTIAENRTFLGGCDGKLHVVDLDTGKAIGEGLPLEGPTGSTPAVVGDIIIAPTQSGAVMAFDWKRSQQLWLFTDGERSQEIRSSPALHGSKAYIATRNRRLLALNLSTGAMEWEYLMKKRSDASPIYGDGRLWLGASDGRLLAVDAESGKEVWSTEQVGALNGGAAIADGRLVIASDKGSILCYGAR